MDDDDRQSHFPGDVGTAQAGRRTRTPADDRNHGGGVNANRRELLWRYAEPDFARPAAGDEQFQDYQDGIASSSSMSSDGLLVAGSKVSRLEIRYQPAR